MEQMHPSMGYDFGFWHPFAASGNFLKTLTSLASLQIKRPA
jgi:hypothetical protein|tara:strand:- start:51 stop:173 length:123 start_codon:yes stop_codon:yes gene_type:complete